MRGSAPGPSLSASSFFSPLQAKPLAPTSTLRARPRRPPAYEPRTLWTGLYGGISGGYASGHSTYFHDHGGDDGTAAIDPGVPR